MSALSSKSSLGHGFYKRCFFILQNLTTPTEKESHCMQYQLQMQIPEVSFYQIIPKPCVIDITTLLKKIHLF